LSNCIILSGGTWSPSEWGKIKRSLGPYRIASALEDSGYSSFVLEYCEEFTSEEIIKALSKHIGEETLWFGFSSTFFWPMRDISNLNSRTTSNTKDQMYYSSEYSEILKVIDYVKHNSKAKIIYGGAKVPFFLVDDKIDYYITGNADNSIIDVTNFIAGKVDTIQHTEIYNDHVIVDSLKYPEPDVKHVSTHWWNKEYNILPNEGLPIELARGCIFKCKFCNYPLLGKKKGTYLRDASQIKDEMIKMWESHGTDSYYLTDDTFNDDNDKLDALHKVFTSLPFKPKFSCYLRVDLINKYPHQADQLLEMGLIGNFFGLETLNTDSAKAIGKGLHPSKVKDRLYWLREKWKDKVNMEAGFILGLPHDTLAYFNELLTWTLEEDNPLQSIHFYPLMLFHYKEKELRPYSSEFSINPEIYGYEFNEGNSAFWSLPSQKLNYRLCQEISNKFTDLRSPMNKIAGFQMITTLNTGVGLEDIYKLTNDQINEKYDIQSMNTNKINLYKSMVGIL
jgi:radical SAM superfamily enzyme YgiQ (UPF0313 family)